MKLSDAIRLGAMIRPQLQGRMFSDKHGTCASGAALEACGSQRFGVRDFTFDALHKLWPWVRTMKPRSHQAAADLDGPITSKRL